MKEKRRMKKMLVKKNDTSCLQGNVSGLRGDVSGLSGYVTGLWGNVDECELTESDRQAGIEISDLIKQEAI